jgi:hypothetical protein
VPHTLSKLVNPSIVISHEGGSIVLFLLQK